MNLKATASLLAGAIALSGAMYVPQASASVSNLGTITTGDSGFGMSARPLSLVNHMFDDSFTFKLTDAGSLVVTGNSILSFSNKGAKIDAFDLYNSQGLVKQGDVSIHDTLTNGNAWKPSLSVSSIAAGDYTIKVHGFASNAQTSNYSFSFSTAPVPEPEEWAMMMVGIGLVGYQVRRKQKGLSQSSLA